jgi:hypothetical protein
MPNNFKLTGDYYVSKFGNDSWDGLTKDTPKRTVQAGLNLITTANKTLIIGAGVYREAINKTWSNNTGIVIQGDGIVNIVGDGGLSFSLLINLNTNNTITIRNINIKNYSLLTIWGASNSGGVSYTFEDCIITSPISIPVSSGLTMVFTRCLLINSSTSSINTNFVISYSILVNSSINLSNSAIYPITTFLNNYISPTSIISAASTITAGNFNYNNIQGSIIMNSATAVTTGTYQDAYGNYYNLAIATSTGTGTLADPYGRPLTNGRAFGFTNHRILYPTFNASSSAYDPKFNSVENYDFSLASDSRMIGAASDGVNNIGGTKYAVRNPAASSAFSGSSATVDAGLGFRYTNYVISGSAVTGSVTSAPILVNNLEKKVLQKVTYNGLLAFNKDTNAPSGSNVNVPDVETFTSASGNAGANPDRLVYYMRFTSGSTVPTTDAQWENAGLWTAGTYNVFEWNTKPSIDLSGRGNGSSSFNPADTQTFIQAQWIQLQIKLRNDYLL